MVTELVSETVGHTFQYNPLCHNDVIKTHILQLKDILAVYISIASKDVSGLVL